jgi:hypothetical protein
MPRRSGYVGSQRIFRQLNIQVCFKQLECFTPPTSRITSSERINVVVFIRSSMEIASLCTLVRQGGHQPPTRGSTLLRCWEEPEVCLISALHWIQAPEHQGDHKLARSDTHLEGPSINRDQGYQLAPIYKALLSQPRSESQQNIGSEQMSCENFAGCSLPMHSIHTWLDILLISINYQRQDTHLRHGSIEAFIKWECSTQPGHKVLDLHLTSINLYSTLTTCTYHMDL